jgi:chromosome segregation ATPase|tara:strand:- start:392 stop:616 length:225 start_codon:yes stop_codon:yes gene_type:complete
MSNSLSIIKALKEAYATLDDARAKLEEVQTDMRQSDDKVFEDTFGDLHGQIDDWLGDLYLMSEAMLDWTGRDDD